MNKQIHNENTIARVSSNKTKKKQKAGIDREKKREFTFIKTCYCF